MSRARIAAWGAAALAIYVAVAAFSFQAGLFPVRPLYQGFAPPQNYRWVDPPPEQQINFPPESASEKIAFVKGESQTLTLATLDGQVTVILDDGDVTAREGETEAVIDVTPRAPKPIGKPPTDLHYDSNAYDVSVRYVKSNEPATLAAPITLVMRYAFGGTAMLRREGATWVPLEATQNAPSLSVFADTDTLGTFVVAAPPQPGAPGSGSRVGDILAAAGGVAVVAAVLVFQRFRKRGKKPPPLKKAPPKVRRRR